MDVTSPHNLVFAEELYEQFLANPASVDPSWRVYFEDVRRGGPQAKGANGNGHAQPTLSPFLTPVPLSAVTDQGVDRSELDLQERTLRLIHAYRARGHKYANLDVLGLRPQDEKGPPLESVGLSTADLDRVVTAGTLPGAPRSTLRELIGHVQETYCRTIGAEFRHIEDGAMRDWLQRTMETTRNRLALSRADQLRILTKLTEAEVFEQFLGTKFVGAKRFSLEGAESLIPMLDLFIDHAGNNGTQEILIGMAHRGRLNVLINIMDKDPESMFAAFDDSRPETYMGSGDVKYHLGFSADRVTSGGNKMHLSLCFNPSHLEFVNPVVEGRVRAKQDRKKDGTRQGTMPILIHGDAAFAGQGVVMETMQLAGLKGYETGGTIHIVVNNQVGFTTDPVDSRSTPYCTDIGRMFHIPVFHVNGEDPEAVAQVVKLAVDFRTHFRKDVIIDLYCYRRHGHNEADEPSFTQPLMYQAISRKRTVREEYIGHLKGLGQVTEQEAEAIKEQKRAALEQSLQKSRLPDFQHKPISAMAGLWSRYNGGADSETPDVDTSINVDLARTLLTRLSAVPEGFAVHPKVARGPLEQRREMAAGTRAVDWGAAEALAFASLLTSGFRVRLSGQDVGRGTFSHRHAVLRSTETGDSHVPLQHLSPDQAHFDVYDSCLSEAGVLGFDYGFSLDYPDALVIWEAQFGDFVNGAQVIIDQFMTSAEVKWNRLSGLTLFLPHGYEGQGPEHSSARVGRFLHMCARDNMQVCNVTTPAQLFHLLRRQVIRPYRKPLVLFTPKSLLRHKAVVSDLSEFASGGFKRLLPDVTVRDKKAVKRVLLCSGKIYLDLDAARVEQKREDVAIMRLEQLYPMPIAQLRAELDGFDPGTPLIWVQEEPWNQGALHLVRGRLPKDLLDRHPFSGVTRDESPSPATGSLAAHRLEQARLVAEALGKKA